MLNKTSNSDVSVVNQKQSPKSDKDNKEFKAPSNKIVAKKVTISPHVETPKPNGKVNASSKPRANIKDVIKDLEFEETPEKKIAAKPSATEATSKVSENKKPTAAQTPKIIEENIDETKLDKTKCLVIKGLHYRITVGDLKRKVPSAKFIRVPVDANNQANNKGFALVYFETDEQFQAAYNDLRVNNKILGRICFVVKYLNAESEKSKKGVDKSNATRQYDKTTLYVTNMPKGRFDELLLGSVFPDCKFIVYVKEKRIAKIRFDSEQKASKYVNCPSPIKFLGNSLKIDYIFLSKQNSEFVKRQSETIVGDNKQSSEFEQVSKKSKKDEEQEAIEESSSEEELDEEDEDDSIEDEEEGDSEEDEDSE
ncbi:MAG: hypothetical protein MHMPM18_000143 [Marteilia pararefringens]